MGEASIRELRNRGGEVVARVLGGEHVIVTRDGEAVAELRPVARHPVTAAVLHERFARLPAIDPERFRDDVDSLIDQAL